MGYLRVVAVAAVCVADFTALDVEDPILNQLGGKRTQFWKIEDEVRWELMLREMWRSLEMVMSSFDEAKFSAWGIWAASSSFTRLSPLLKIGARLASSTKKTSKTTTSNYTECEECLSQMAKEFFTGRISLARTVPVLTSLSAFSARGQVLTTAYTSF